MNKLEIVDLISERLKKTKKDVREILDEFLEIITYGLQANKKITLSNFGIFESKDIGHYKRFHPQTGETISTRFAKRIYFRASENMKRIVNGEIDE